MRLHAPTWPTRLACHYVENTQFAVVLSSLRAAREVAQARAHGGFPFLLRSVVAAWPTARDARRLTRGVACRADLCPPSGRDHASFRPGISAARRRNSA